jgi:hypothetical protein
MLPAVLGSITGALGGGAVAKGVASLGGVLLQNKWNKQSAREQMAFQERMSGTAYARAMQDMRNAGLNPILASKLGGASSPAGAMAAMQDPISPAISTALQAQQVDASTALQEANTSLVKANTLIAKSNLPYQAIKAKLYNHLDNIIQGLESWFSSGFKGDFGKSFTSFISNLKEFFYNKGDNVVTYINNYLDNANMLRNKAMQPIVDFIQEKIR